MDVQDVRHYPSPLRVQAGVGPEASLGIVRRDDLTVVRREDATRGPAGYLEAVRTLLGRLRRPRIVGWCAIVLAAAVVEYLSSNHATNFLWTTAVLTVAWFFGVAFASRTAQTRRVREQVAAAEERAASQERARIAHELHDVVAHSVSEMVVQASGVRYSLTDAQSREREALRSIEQIGREALTEMRRMLGVMPGGGDDQPAELAPQPGLAHLDRLIAEVQRAGLPVTLHVEGDRPTLPIGIDLSAYRIVQEGLANALRHDGCAHADVTVRFAGEGIEVEIADDGAAVNGSGRSEGESLAGMRERVALYGGTLQSGPRAGGGYLVRAQLPVEEP
jgi:signal transduction histidine kinase